MGTTYNGDTPDYIVDGVLTDGEAWVPLITTTVDSGGAASITWASQIGSSAFKPNSVNNWSQYQDLIIISNCRNEGASNDYTLIVEPNADTYDSTKNLSQRIDTGQSSTSYAAWQGYMFMQIASAGGGSTANTFTGSITTLYDINSGKWLVSDTLSSMERGGAGTVGFGQNAYKRTTGVSSLKIRNSGGVDLAEGSRFDLFGVLPRMVS